MEEIEEMEATIGSWTSTWSVRVHGTPRKVAEEEITIVLALEGMGPVISTRCKGTNSESLLKEEPDKIEGAATGGGEEWS